jgi:hypothetical protein
VADKFPFLQLYVTDWRTDPCLSQCSPATRGIWIDVVCAMWEMDRCGQLVGTCESLARVARCNPAEMLSALQELHRTTTADVTPCPGAVTADVTVTNRRMRKEWAERKGAAIRKDRQRKGEASQDADAPGHADVTPDSRDIFQRSEVIGQKETLAQPPAERATDSPVLIAPTLRPRFDLDALYAAYPRKEGKAKGMSKLRSLVDSDAAYVRHQKAIANLVARIARDGIEPQFIPHFSTWTAGKWLDYADGIPAPVSAKSNGAPSPAAPRPRPSDAPLPTLVRTPPPRDLRDPDPEAA